MCVSIRKCAENDLPEIMNLMRELEEVSGSHDELSQGLVQKLHTDMESLPQVYLNLVAEVDGKVAGFISVIFYKTFFHKGGTAMINELIVSRSYRGQGIGGALIKWAVAEAKKRAMDEIEVGTEISNDIARQFYKKCGFDEEYVLLGMEFE